MSGQQYGLPTDDAFRSGDHLMQILPDEMFQSDEEKLNQVFKTDGGKREFYYRQMLLHKEQIE